MLVEIILLIVVVLLAKLYFDARPPNFPPGPTAYSVVGSFISLVSRRPIQEILYFLFKVQGPYVGLKLGGKWTVAVNGFQAVKEVLSREDCSFRPTNIILMMRSFDKKLGILFSDGPLWKLHRRFAIRHLRDFGFGKTSTERTLLDEADALCESLRRRRDECPEGAEVQDLFPVSVINVLWAMMSGERHDHDDEDFKRLLENISEYTRQGNPVMLTFPWLRFIPFVNRPLKKLNLSAKILQEFVKDTADQHMATYQEGETRDFIDVFIQDIKKEEHPTFTLEQLIVVCMDLFLGGTDTTSNALAFIFLYLAVHPEVQDKMRREIQEISQGAEPSLKDSPKYCYFHAVIQEVLRHSCMVPMTPPHAIESDIALGDYNVPKGSIFLVNLYSVLMDKEHWGDPEAFRPERFIDESGKFFKDSYCMSFGHGPRMCLGEPLARDTMFIFLTSVFSKFKFSVPQNEKVPTLEPKQGLVLCPKPYKLVITEIV